MVEPSRTIREFSGPLTPNNPTRVTIRIKPPAGTSTYAIEESVPAAWTISDPGDGFASAGKIRFGPYYDNQERILAYTVVPDAADSIASLSGMVSYDGLIESISSAVELLRAERISGDEVRIHCTGASGNQYVLETAPSIDSEAWTSIGTIENGQYIVRTATASKQFYRIRPVTAP